MFDDILGPVLSSEITWPATDKPIPDTDMAGMFAQTENIHKSAHFVSVYDETFQPYRHKPIRMLEVGVACGGSLELWRKFFRNPESIIVGIDGNPQCARFDDPDRNVHVRIGQQQDTGFLSSVVDEFGSFDIVLDDGSHLPSYTLQTFRHLLPHIVDGGVYLVEDLEWCYMPCGAADGSPTFVEVVKILMDLMHAHYFHASDTEEFQVDSPKRLEAVRVPLVTTLIDSIRFYDSIVVIHCKARELPRLLFKVSDEFLSEWLA